MKDEVQYCSYCGVLADETHICDGMVEELNLKEVRDV